MVERDDAERAGSAFRSGLREELPRWRAEGLIDENVERVLVERYRLDEKGADLATTAVYVLGALLVGGGVISFVAWNWSDIPDAAKLALIGGAMIAADVVGYRMWKTGGSWPRVGHALVLVGTLIYGANIGLVAQIYNIHSNWYAGFAAWAFGAALAGWCLRSVPNAALGVVLATVWGCGFANDHGSNFPVAPFVIAAAFVPFAWRERSRLVLALTIVGLCFTAGWSAGEETAHEAAVYATELSIATALLAWTFAFADGSRGARLAGPARALGVLGYGALAYVASFERAGRNLSLSFFWRDPSLVSRPDLRMNWTLFALPAFLTAAAFLVLARRRAADFRSRSPSLAALGGAALLVACMFAPPDGLWMTVAGNAALVVPALVAVAASVRELDRGSFWVGTLTLGLVVVTRFFEFDTNLGVKAAAFVGAGVAVILVGVAFEKRLRARGDAA